MNDTAKPRSLLPNLSAPVDRRRLHLPQLGVDLIHGDTEALFALRMALLHGANFNDPAGWTANHGGSCCRDCFAIT